MQKKDVLFLFVYMALAIIGFFTIPFPDSAMRFVVLALGIIFTAWGGITFIQYINKTQKKENTKITDVLLSALFLLIGILLLVFNKGASLVFFPVIIGIFALVSGVLSTIDVFKLKKNSFDIKFSLIAMIISYAVGFIILIYISINHSFKGDMLGIYMIVFGVVKTIETSLNGRRLRPAH